MSVKCGNHKVHGRERVLHDTIADVRACFQQSSAPKTVPAPAPAPAPAFRRQPQAAPDRMATLLRQPGQIAISGILHKGYFTVTFEDGSRRTLRVRRQDKDAKFKPGTLLIGYLNGSNNEVDYQNVAEVREFNGQPVGVSIWMKHRDKTAIVEAIKVLCGDPQAAAKAYAQESDHCSNCNRPLTVPQGPKSQKLNPYRDDGYGPDCGEEILGGSVAA